MKKKLLYLFAALGLGLSACSDFGDLNADPEAIGKDNMDYKLLFTNV